MARFLFGDELGNLKVLKYSEDATSSKAEVKTVLQHAESSENQRIGVQAIYAHAAVEGAGILSTAVFSDGSTNLYRLQDDDTLETICKWHEPRLKENRFIGLSLTDRAVYSCTSNGALRRTGFSGESGSVTAEETRFLPTRLCHWKSSQDEQSFAYGGEEVALSVWSTEQAFQRSQPSASENMSDKSSGAKKRKRNDALFPGELWRAKNNPNDGLSLRQPIRITSLSFISASSCHLVAGSQAGDVQRYDTRAARRPVADWKGIGKVGGIKCMQPGLNENELFVSDQASNLYSVDLRNGNILYGYPGISGAVTAIAPSATVMASTSLDRYVRLHSTYPPAKEAGSRLSGKGGILEKSYVNSVPTCLVWDGRLPGTSIEGASAREMDESADDIWDELDNASDTDDGDDNRKLKRRHILA